MSFITALFAAVGFVSSVIGIVQFSTSKDKSPRRKFGISSLIGGVVLILAILVMNISGSSKANQVNTNTSQGIINNSSTQAPTDTPTNPPAPTDTPIPTEPPAPTSAPTSPPVATYTTPNQTINQYCSDIDTGQYEDAYNQLYTQSFHDNTSLSYMEGYRSCRYSPSSLYISGSIASETIQLLYGNVWYTYRCTLVQDSNGNWLIDKICQC